MAQILVQGTILQVNTSLGGLPKRAISDGYITPLGVEGDLHAVRQSTQDGDTLHVRVEIERDDQPAFIEHTERLWPALATSGTVVEVEVVPMPRQCDRANQIGGRSAS